MTSRKYDCIFIPGGGLREDGSLPPWTIARLEAALEIQDQAKRLIPLSGGTVHKPPPLDPAGYPVYESRAAAAYLVASGISPGRVLTEICSYDTIGNAYFARALFSDPLALASCLVITSTFHLPRCEAIFHWVYSLQPVQQEYSLNFLGTPDAGMPPDALGARVKREKKGLEKLGSLIRKIDQWDDFQDWLYSEHQAYASGGSREQLSEDELSSY